MKGHCFAAALAAVALSFAAPASAAVIVITHSKALAGGITPPDTPGYPVTLSLPGAYRLDTNLTVPSGKNGLHVTSQYVDIDMNGFRLWGWNAAATNRIANNGVYSTLGISSIRNGYISGFRFDGIRLVDVTASSWVVEDMQIFGNGGNGIAAGDSNYHRFARNSILRNTLAGIECGNFCRIDENTVSDNFSDGILCDEDCHVEGNVVIGNDGIGVFLTGGTVLGNTISGNLDFGIANNPIGGGVGFGNNTLDGNNEGDGQINAGVDPLEPNYCQPMAC